MRNGFTNCLIQLSVNRVCRLGEEYPALGSEDHALEDEEVNPINEDNDDKSSDNPNVRFRNDLISETIIESPSPATGPVQEPAPEVAAELDTSESNGSLEDERNGSRDELGGGHSVD